MAHHAFSSRSALLAASAAVLVAGCAAHRGNPNTGAVVVTGAAPAQPPAEMGPVGSFDARRVSPAFTRAVGDFAREVSRIDMTFDANPSFTVQRALGLLADAIEAAPYAQGEVHVATAIDTLRSERRRLMVAFPPQPILRVGTALDASADAFDALAQGPYHASPTVAERERAFRASIDALRYPERLRGSHVEVVNALHNAALVLTSMHTALARGVVP